MNNIRKAAEIVGWGLYSDVHVGLYYDPEIEGPRNPVKCRGDLHALAGLLEDTVRKKHPGLTVTNNCTGASVYPEIYHHKGECLSDNKDPLLAKLEALLKAVGDE